MAKKIKEEQTNVGCTLQVLFLFILFFVFGFVGQLFDYKLEKEDLQRVTGVIETVDVEQHRASKRSSSSSEIIFTLKGVDEEYILTFQNYSDADQMVDSYVKPNVSVEFYHRHRWQQLIGWGAKNRAYHFETKDYMILDRAARTRPITLIIIPICGGVLLALWIWYLSVFLKQRKNANQNS